MVAKVPSSLFATEVAGAGGVAKDYELEAEDVNKKMKTSI
jgi:hypothetical protein